MPDVRLVTAAVLPVPDPDLGRLQRALTARDGRRRRGEVARPDRRLVGHAGHGAALAMGLRRPARRVPRVGRSRGTRRPPLWNPPALVRWNTHKAYLLELASLGAPVVPTVLLARRERGRARPASRTAQGWNAVVVKPAVAVGAGGAGRFDVGDGAGQEHLDALLVDGDVLVQPYAVRDRARGGSLGRHVRRPGHARGPQDAGRRRLPDPRAPRRDVRRDRPRRAHRSHSPNESRRRCPRRRSMPAST